MAADQGCEEHQPGNATRELRRHCGGIVALGGCEVWQRRWSGCLRAASHQLSRREDGAKRAPALCNFSTGRIHKFMGQYGPVLFLTPRAWSRFLPRERLKTKSQLRILAGVATLAIVSPIVLINLSLAFFGSSVVFPLSPFFLGEKLSALGAYAAHRPICLVTEHPDVPTLISRAE